MQIIYNILGYGFIVFIWAFYAVLAIMGVGVILLIGRGLLWLLHKAAHIVK